MDPPPSKRTHMDSGGISKEFPKENTQDLLKLMHKSLFAIGPIAQTIVSHLEPEDFMHCLEICSTWNLALNQPFLWKQAFLSATKFLTQELIDWDQSKKDDILARQSEWKDWQKKLSLPELQLITLYIATYQKHKDDDKHEIMFDFFRNLEYPYCIAQTAASARNLNFFKFHLDMIENADMNQEIENVKFLKKCMQETLLTSGEGDLWWILAEFIQKLPFEVLLDFDNNTPNFLLCEAASWGNRKIVELLLNTIPSSQLKNEGFLHNAIEDLEMVKIIVEKLPPHELMYQDESGETALHVAAEVGCVEVVKFLISKMPLEVLMTQNSRQQTALHLAAREGHFELVLELTKHMPLEAMMIQDDEKQTALHLATSMRHFEIVKILIDLMPREALFKIDSEGYTALEMVLDEHNGEITQLLVNKMFVDGPPTHQERLKIAQIFNSRMQLLN